MLVPSFVTDPASAEQPLPPPVVRVLCANAVQVLCLTDRPRELEAELTLSLLTCGTAADDDDALDALDALVPGQPLAELVARPPREYPWARSLRGTVRVAEGGGLNAAAGATMETLLARPEPSCSLRRALF